MTAAEWDACADPTPMLEFLRGKVSERKLRLFAVACLWLVGRWLTDERSRRVVEMTEQFVVGMASGQDLAAAAEAMLAGADDASYEISTVYAVASAPADVAARAAILLYASSKPKSALLRDIIGNPFRPAPAVDPAWLACERRHGRRAGGGDL